MKRLIGSAAMIAALALPLGAQANTVNPQVGAIDGIQGTIASFDGKYGLTIRETDGPLQRVTLHRGTIIVPSGLRLGTGMLVTVLGHPDADGFTANAIDAPVEEAMRAPGAGARIAAPTPPTFAPSGTFQTTGPSAEGGG